MKKSLLIVLLASIGLGLGCDKSDEFADAPTVGAPPASDSTAPPAVDPNKAAPLPPGSKMPAGHPPTGSAGAAAVAPSNGKVGFASPAEFGTKGPLRWTSPDGWTASKPASSMRLAEYVVPGVGGSQPGTVSIFYFGASGGGGVEANVNRWLGQFKQADGRTSQEVAKRETKVVNGMNVHLVSVAGTFSAGMAGNAPPQADTKMRGAIVESPVGLFFFKLVGPTATVDGASGLGFDTMVDSFAPGT